MENQLNFKGEVKFISQEEVIMSKDGSKEYKKQYFVVQDNKEYPNEARFDVFNKPDMFDTFTTGDVVEVEFNTKVNAYQDKHFCSLNAWKVKLIEKGKVEQNISEQSKQPDNQQDDLPF